jgi:hypothetical protein
MRAAEDIRACPECGQPQEWCTLLDCAWPFAHWSHTTTAISAACRNLADRNRDPGKPPDNAYTRGEL